MYILQITFLVIGIIALTSALPNSVRRNVFSRRSDTGQKDTEEDSSRLTSLFSSVTGADYTVIEKVLDDCLKSKDGVTCLKRKTVTFMDNLAKLKSIPLFDGVFLSKREGERSEPPVLNENELEVSLPRDLNQKSYRLDQMIYDRLLNFWNTRTLTLDFDSHNVEEGRRRRHKKLFGHLMMAFAAAAATVGPIFFKSLAALAFKALITSKIALVLSAILAYKHLGHHHGGSGGGGGGGGDSHRSYAFEEVELDHHWPTHEHLRSFDISSADNAHRMAYSTQLQ